MWQKCFVEHSTDVGLDVANLSNKCAKCALSKAGNNVCNPVPNFCGLEMRMFIFIVQIFSVTGESDGQGRTLTMYP